ncbi:TIGR02281 family clan AA aspartic protease [Stappia sp. F7233]|uniref:TIGR02281 family clan AA aspartic protease n=1 Tax=Stappia albiluteola TaxID=2758565 RepID=A0A839AB38_9HYPH|nr:TIGR02281 family clan AA aspartic protease [Stappia albiluteola]MBA5776244.1 TIGR02281 family clan AA aspartic protease [Stappia albiluteola]
MFRYLSLLGVVIVTALVVPDVMERFQAEQQAAAVEAKAAASSGGRILVLQAKSDGHYYTKAWVNGRAIDALIDTGASTIALPMSVARSAGVIPRADEFTASVRTANGVARAAPVDLREFRLGTIRLTNVRALVLPEGALGITLVGMSALSKLSKVDIRNGTMKLVQ